jgi:hypothetical protein
MKTKLTLQIVFISAILVTGIFSTGCAGPAARHNARVDRREDAADRAGARQDIRYDRRADRRDRIDDRYSY